MQQAVVEITAEIEGAKCKETTCAHFAALLRGYKDTIDDPAKRARMDDTPITTRNMMIICIQAAIYQFYDGAGVQLPTVGTALMMPGYVKEFLEIVDGPITFAEISAELKRSQDLLRDATYRETQTAKQIAELEVYIICLQVAMFEFYDVPSRVGEA